jgi:membrane protein DedA with SNARE-associated domain
MLPLLLLAVRAFSGALTSFWTQAALGASVILFEEAVPVLAGFVARQEHLRLTRAVLVCALGGWGATLVPYAVGWWGASRLLRRWKTGADLVKKLAGPAARRPWRAALASRFLFGARTLLPLACGTARVPAIPFVVGSAISSFVWSATFITVGWMSGETVLHFLGKAKRHELDAALILAAIVLVAVFIVQRRNRPHVVEELGGSD